MIKGKIHKAIIYKLTPKEFATIICEGLDAHPLAQHSSTKVLGVHERPVAKHTLQLHNIKVQT